MMFIRRDGASMYFCSRKCRVNRLHMKRTPRRVRWTNEFHNLKAMKQRSSKNE